MFLRSRVPPSTFTVMEPERVYSKIIPALKVTLELILVLLKTLFDASNMVSLIPNIASATVSMYASWKKFEIMLEDSVAKMEFTYKAELFVKEECK